MLEKIARALAELSPRDTFHYTYDQNPGEYEEIVIAVLTAMREPDDAMKDAGMDAIDHLDAWASMIDAILASQPQEQER